MAPSGIVLLFASRLLVLRRHRGPRKWHNHRSRKWNEWNIFRKWHLKWHYRRKPYGKCHHHACSHYPSSSHTRTTSQHHRCSQCFSSGEL
ncbi:hypothetical protein OSTOST_19967 [Ostertagia ostertagi]